MSVMKEIGYSLLKIVEYHIIPFFGMLCNTRNKYVNVIYYHDIVHDAGDSYMRTNIDVFTQQMVWLFNNGYETVRFDDLDDEHVRFKNKRILIAFDDGWLSNYTEIFGLMQELGLKYNVFLTMGEIGNNPDYLTWELVKKMHDSGFVGFGAHTFTHPSMEDLSIIDYDHEVKDADDLFEKQLGYRPIDFCYPYGFYSESSNLRLEKESSYKRIYTSEKLYSYNQNDCVVFGRNGISTDYTLCYFKKKVKGYANWHQLFDTNFYEPMMRVYHRIK